MTVEYPRSEQAYYLTSILKSLFEHDRFIRRMITGLSRRNIEEALEIFLEFCNSGHIGEDVNFQNEDIKRKLFLTNLSGGHSIAANE